MSYRYSIWVACFANFFVHDAAYSASPTKNESSKIGRPEVSDCLGSSTVAEYTACEDEKQTPMLGKYYCVITDIAGLQGGKGRRRSFSRLEDKDSKFFIEITRDASLPCGSLSPFHLGMKDDACRTKYKMVAKTEVIGSPAYGVFMLQDFTSPRGNFTITKNGEFWGNYNYEVHYVYEGKCEKLN